MHLHHLLLRELFEVGPAQIARQHEGRGQHRAAVTGMALDDLTLPLRIEQVGVALRRVLALDQVGIVADRLGPCAGGGMHSVRVDLIGGKISRHLIGNVWREPAVVFPVEIVRRVGAVGDVDRPNAAALLLGDTLENPLRARTLDAHGNAGIFDFEHPAHTLGGVEFQRDPFMPGRLEKPGKQGRAILRRVKAELFAQIGVSDDLERETIAPIRRTVSGLGDGHQTRLIADTRPS